MQLALNCYNSFTAFQALPRTSVRSVLHHLLVINCRRLPSNRRRLSCNYRWLPSNRRRLPSNRHRLPCNCCPSPFNRHRLPSNCRPLPSKGLADASVFLLLGTALLSHGRKQPIWCLLSHNLHHLVATSVPLCHPETPVYLVCYP